MELKSEQPYMSDDNFVQRNGNLEELSIEITLCEYRELVVNNALMQKRLYELEEENKKLSEANSLFGKTVLRKNPELIAMMQDIVNSIFSTDEEETDAEHNTE